MPARSWLACILRPRPYPAASWTTSCSITRYQLPDPAKYEPPAILTATGEEMKALLALPLIFLLAAPALAQGADEVARDVSGFALALTEPVYLLLSGTALLIVACALRRLGA